MKTGLICGAVMALATSSAFAGDPVVPEPGILGLFAGAAVAGIVIYRLRRRK